MGKGCRCRGMFERDISPWCEIHATREKLTDKERVDFIKRLEADRDNTQKRIDLLKGEPQ